MKKILFTGIISVLAFIPQILKAQEAEAPNPDEMAAKADKAPAAAKTPADASDLRDFLPAHKESFLDAHE